MNNRLPRYKRNFRVNFFLSDKIYMAIEAVEWSKWIISVGISSLFLMYTARERIFGFGKNKFA